MPVSVVRLGSARSAREGLRIGTVRRPPRGVPKARFASDNWYDVWLPELSPSEATVRLGQNAGTDAQWRAFEKRYAAEMAAATPSRILDTSPRFRRTRAFPWAAIARTRRAATARCCAGC
jgi:uncharacterized protein YeaO (DUF488 family)